MSRHRFGGPGLDDLGDRAASDRRRGPGGPARGAGEPGRGSGQDAPNAQRAGHDINYIAVSGAMWPMGRKGERPVPPLNLVGDFGGGSLYLVAGVLAAIIESRSSGLGQVIDCAIVDGVSSLASMMWEMRSAGDWGDSRGTNLLDGGRPFYAVYETADGGWFSVGALEPQFFEPLVNLLGMEAARPRRSSRPGSADVPR